MTENTPETGMFQVVYYGMDNYGVNYNGVCFIAPTLAEAKDYVKNRRLGPDDMIDPLSDSIRKTPTRRRDINHYARIYLTGQLVE